MFFDRSRLSKKNLDLVLLSLIGALIVFDLPFFLGITLPLHDTFGFLQIFSFFYNDFFYSNELAFWMPFDTYGLQSNFYLVAMTPAHFFAGIVGRLFGIEDILFLFKFSTFLEHLIFLYGTYLLAKTIFKHKTTIAFVCLVSIGSMVFISQVSWNFYLFYLLPLTIYLVRMFFATYKLQYGILAMIVFIFSGMPGGAPYLAVVGMLGLAIISTAMFASNFRNIGKIFTLSRRDYTVSAFYLLMLCLLVISYWALIRDASVFTELQSPARNPETGQVDLNVFLHYGSFIDYWKFSELFNPLYRITGLLSWGIISFDFTLFIGLIPLIFILYSFLEAKNVLWLGFAVTTAVLMLWSVGDNTLVATALYKYFFPMKYFRHIGYVASALKLFLPFLAGFGLDRTISNLNRWTAGEESKKKVLLAEIPVALMAVIGSIMLARIAFNKENEIFSKIFQFSDVDSFRSAASVYITITIGIVLFLMFLLMKRRIQPVKHFSILLICLTVFELASYQGTVNGVFHSLIRQIKEPYTNAFVTDKYDFQWPRTRYRPISKEARKRHDLINTFNRHARYLGASYALTYNFIQWDPCVPQGRVDFINSNVASLIRLKGGVVQTRILPPQGDPFLSSLGCDSPKLQLVQDVVFSNSSEETAQLLRNTQNPGKALVLNNVPHNIQSKWLSSPRRDIREDATIQVIDFRANGISMEASLPEGTGAWLYYMDAWHSGWKATVNNVPVPVAQANLAFKAIPLEGGLNKVEFFYDAGMGGIGALVVCFAAIIFASVILASVVFGVLFAHDSRKDLDRDTNE